MTPFDKIKEYIKTGNIDPIWEDYDVLNWVDWRDFDSDIVNYFKDYIESEDYEGIERDEYDVDIIYKGNKYSINYPNDYADRDTTLISLNEIISDEYDIRLAEESDGNDTLAFSILKNTEWKALEDEFGTDTVNKFYRKIKRGEAIFG